MFVVWMVGYLAWRCFPQQLITRQRYTRFLASNESVYEELEDIASRLRSYDYQYYESPEGPTISDAEYDALAEREALLCQQNPDIWKEYRNKSGLGIQATRYQGRVGSQAKKHQEHLKNSTEPETLSRTHAAKLLSLENVHDTEQLIAWLERVRKKTTSDIAILSEPKLDGLSLAIRYNRTALQWAATRGDGTTGTDVTNAIESIPNIPRIVPPEVTEVRGEVILPPRLANDFSNARNAASGILFRKKDDEDNMRSQLRFYAYDTVPPVQNMRDALISWGFSVPNPAVVSTLPQSDTPYSEDQIRPLLNYADKILSLRTNEQQDFDTDGCVHKIVDTTLRETLGSSQRAPRWAVAHKFPPIAKVTELQDIVVQVGRTGVLTPVAILSPVDILGVNIQRATLHNFEHLQTILKSETSIPKNSTVLVRRAGDVIPQVISLVHKSHEKDEISLALPTQCPVCGSKTVEDGAKAIRCSGATWECPPQAIASLEHAFSRDALDIKGISGAKLTQLRSEGLISKPSDLFELAKNKGKLEQLKGLDGWGEKSAIKLAATANQIASQGVSFQRFLYSLGITALGLNAARLVSEVYGSWRDVLVDLQEASSSVEEENSFARLREETDETKGIGPTLVSNLWNFARTPELLDAAVALAKCLLIIDVSPKTEKVVVDGKPFSGLSVMFSGTISKTLSRKDLQQRARELGAKATPTKLTKTTGVLVCGPRSSGKRKEAESLGVKVMDGEEFLRISHEHIDFSPQAQSDNQSTSLETTGNGRSDDSMQSTTPFRGAPVVFTGSVAKDCTRSMAQELALKLGAKSTPNQVTKSTGFVVEGEKAAASKLEKAASFGVKIMNAQQFLQIARENNILPPHMIDVMTTEKDNKRPFEGFTVVFSGSISDGVTRKVAQDMARTLGASSTPSKLSKKTDLVISGARASKTFLTQAESLNIRVMSSDEFLQLSNKFMNEANDNS